MGRTCRFVAHLAAGLLIAACGGCAAVSTGQPVVVHAGRVSYHGYGGTAIVGTDGRTITVGLYPAEDCPATITPVARESATRVALFLEYVTPSSSSPCMHVSVALVDAHDIRLREPLGNRELVDGATGRVIAWISARLVLLPTVLSHGYQLGELIPAGVKRTLSPGPAGCLQRYVTSGKELEIGQSAGRVLLPVPGPGGWTPIRVRGHPGLAARNVITWRENGLTDYISVNTSPLGRQPLLSTAQLVAIADSAPAYNAGPLPVPARY